VALDVTIVETVKGGKVIAVAAAKTKKQVVLVARATVTLVAGQIKTVHLSLNRTGRQLLAERQRFPAKLVARQVGRTVSTSTLVFKIKHG
jgi:hypothetical protein